MGVEREIVEAARGGDPGAFNALVEDFTPTVFAAAYGWCGDRHLAADIAQEVFTIAYVKLDTLRDPAAIAGWLMTITRTVARRATRGRPLAATAEPQVAPVEDEVIAADEARRVRYAVEALPTDLRVPIVLHYFAGRPLSEIAELCSVPLSTVKKRMRDARARIRRGGLDMDHQRAETMLGAANRGLIATDTIRVFTALRTGDPALLAALLDARPDLVDVREDWSGDEGWRHGLLPTHGGTPLLRAVERGDHAMIRLLLERGGDPDGACSCDGAENPMWVASVQGDAVTVEMLLARSADPNRPAFAGLTPLDLATIRGHDRIAQLLRNAGGERSATARSMLASVITGRGTGIKAVDLWCPLPERGLVHVHFAYGTGVMVLLCELSRRWAAGGQHVVWTGFVPRPLDLGDIHHALAEAGLAREVTIALTDHTVAHDRRRAQMATFLADSDEHDIIVVFSDAGFRDAVDERLFDLAARKGLTVVVSPIDDPEMPRFGSAPYLASIRFDRERAQRGRWPAISAGSWSVAASPDMAELATRARRLMSDELDQYLCQPFLIAEHVTARPGESVSLTDLAAEITSRLGIEAP
jgi:RNA polymerase sigma-70 factor, ECF subfamily